MSRALLWDWATGLRQLMQKLLLLLLLLIHLLPHACCKAHYAGQCCLFFTWQFLNT
jgi:hypothetical protein